MPRVRVINIGRRPRGFYATGGRFVALPVGGTTDPVSIDDGTERALFNSGDVEFDYLDGDDSDRRATLLAKASTMPAAEFREAAGALLGREFATKRAAVEALENGGDGGRS